MKTVQDQIQSGLIGGAVVLVGDPDKDLFSYAAGCADWETGLPMTQNTVFDIASVTKVVGTNSVLLFAIADGLLDPDQPFTDYLPEFTGKMPGPVKVRDLAQHISGVNIRYCHTGTHDEMYKGILDVDFPVPVGERFEYTCTNYILIGFMLERIFGRKLNEIAEERLFQPLGMTETNWTQPADGLLPRTIRTVNADPGIISDFGAQAYFPRPLGNAGIFSTAADMAKFARMMLKNDGSIFPQEVLELCFTNFNPSAVQHPRSIGWDMDPAMMPNGLSEQTISHSGWTGQTMWIDRGTDRFVIVLTNRKADWALAKFGRRDIAAEVLTML